MSSPVLGATAYEFALRRYGRPVRIDERVVSVSTTLTELLPENPRRLHWTINNRGGGNVAFGHTSNLTFATGFLLGASGGFATMDVLEDGETVAWRVFAIAEYGAQNVRVLEVIAL